MPLKTESGLHYAGSSLVEVRVGIDNDRVLAAHFRDHAFEPHLAGLHFGGALVNAQANLFRTRKRDEASLRMIDYDIANFCA